MLLVKCTGEILDKEIIQKFAETDHRKQREFERSIQKITNMQILEGLPFYFIADEDEGSVTIGALVDRLEGLENGLRRYLSSLKISLSNVEYEEVIIRQFRDMLDDAHSNRFVQNARNICNEYGMEELYDLWGNDYYEKILEDAEERHIISKAEKMYIGNTLVPEIKRIYEGKKIKKAEGHPVHYMIQANDNELKDETINLLYQALYDNKRINSKRMTVVHVEENRGFRRGDMRSKIECFYKAGKGGAVVIDYHGEEEAEGEYASTHRDTIKMLSEIMNKYSNNVLTIYCFPKECTRIKGWFYEYLGDVSMVELKEEFVSGTEARNVLSKKASEHHVRTDKELMAHISDDNKYLLRDLDKDFDLWYRKKLKRTVYPQYQCIETASMKKSTEAPKGTAYEELSKMIGLTNAKKVINQALDYYKAQKVFRDRGIDQDHPSMHMVFTGNPGTAKTTVARLFADIMKDNGILSTGKLVEVGRGDLVGKYVGWTATIVKDRFNDAKGGVLFVDEAYSLVDDRNGMFGDEAINTIVQEMENHRDEVVVIFAGYPDKMEEFLDKNPGLRSRIAFHVSFDDYNVEELCEISKIFADKKGMHFTDEAMERLKEVFLVAIEQPDFGNGRYVRNVMEKARMAQSTRLLSKNIDDITKEDILTFSAEDIELPKVKVEKHFKMGFACA